MMTVMSYPPSLLNALMTRLVDHRAIHAQTLEWLLLECQERELEVPSESAFYRFAALVRREYEIAFFLRSRETSDRIIQEIAGDDPLAKQRALNAGLTTMLSDEVARAARTGPMETKRLLTIIAGIRTVQSNTMDEKKMNARIEAQEKINQQRDATIKLLQQRLAKLPEQVKAVEAHLDQVEKAQAAGKKVDASVYAAIRAELTRVKEPGVVAA